MSNETTECPNGDCGVLLNRSDVSEDGGCRYCLQNSDALARWASAEPSAADGGERMTVEDALVVAGKIGSELMPIGWGLALHVLAAEVRRLREQARKDEATYRRSVDRLVAEVEKALRERDQLRAELREVAGELMTLPTKDEALRLHKLEDCGQDAVCAISPGCARHWEERNRELVAERDQLRAEAEKLRTTLRAAIAE